MNLENIQRASQGKPPEETEPVIHAAIVAFRHALREKKKLDAEHRDLHQLLAIAEAVP